MSGDRVLGSGRKQLSILGADLHSLPGQLSNTVLGEMRTRDGEERIVGDRCQARYVVLSGIVIAQAQPRPLAVRLSLMGSVFHLEDFRLNSSHTQLRYLPLKMTVGGTTGNPKQMSAVNTGQASGSGRGKRISTSVRLLVRTAFLPEQKTFNVFFSSVFSVRNRSSVPLLVR